MKKRVRAWALVSMVIVLVTYCFVIIVAMQIGLYRMGALGVEPFTTAIGLIAMLVVHFAVKPFNIPTYMKTIIYLSLGCTVMFLQIWLFPTRPPGISQMEPFE